MISYLFVFKHCWVKTTAKLLFY